MTYSKKTTLMATFGLALASIIWGFAFIIIKSALDTISPLYILAFRFSIAAIALCAVFFKKLKSIDRSYLKNGIILSVMLFISFVLQTYGLKYTTTGNNAFLTGFYVICVPFLHWIISKKRPNTICFISAVIGMSGIGLITLTGFNMQMNKGDILTLMCAVGFAMHIVYVDKYTEKQDPILLTILQISFSAVYSWIFAPIVEGAFPKAVFTLKPLLCVLYLGVFSTLICYLLQNVGQKYVHPSAAALLLSSESVFGALFAVLILHEHMSGRLAIGGMLLIAAIMLSQLRTLRIHTA